MKIMNPLMQSLLQKYQNIHALRYLITLTNWDTETYMPKNGIETRGTVLGKVEKLIQQLALDPDYIADLNKLNSNFDQLNVYEKAILRVLNKYNNKYQKLPPAFVEDYAKLTAQASTVWAQSRKNNDFNTFKPYLAEVFTKTRQMCEFLGYDKHPYEALVDEYEPGVKMQDFDNYFTDLKRILAKFNLQKVIDTPDLPSEFSITQLKKVTQYILNYFEADRNAMRLDQSAHPFTNSIANNDIRITTNYHKSSPLSAIYSTIHEYGHGLFAYQTDPELELTPLFMDISYGIHESQSRFWENLIGRSQTFIDLLLPHMQKLGVEYQKISSEEIYQAANEVKPGLIRIEADELTYHSHILIRYEVEKALLEGSLKIDGAPEFWNMKYKEYLGVSSPNYANGIMQDIHWSLGYIGYFPTYSLGTILAAAIYEKIQNSVGNIETLIQSTTGIKKIQKWLAVNIHNHGGTYTYKEVFQKISHQDLDLKPWDKYMSQKFKHLLN